MAAKHFKRYRVTLGGDTAHSDWIAPPPVGEPWPERDQTPRNAWYCDAEVDLPTASEDAKIGDWAFAIAESTSWKRIAGPAWEQITGGGGEHPDLATHDAMGLATDSELSTHAAAGDPHTGYRLESADHTHQSTGLQGGTLDHGLALTGLADDDHPQYATDTDLTTHAGAVDPHTGYRLESVVLDHTDLSGITTNQHHNQAHAILDGTHTTFPGGSTEYLREDGTWDTPPGTGGEALPYAVRFDDDVSGVAYLGEADPGSTEASAVWRIKKITTTGIDISTAWADGNSNFDNVWNDHLTLSYS
jgi:hypothetical protein